MRRKVLSTNKIKGFRAFLTLFLRDHQLRNPNNDAPFIPYSLQMQAIPPTQGRGELVGCRSSSCRIKKIDFFGSAPEGRNGTRSHDFLAVAAMDRCIHGDVASSPPGEVVLEALQGNLLGLGLDLDGQG